MADNTNEAGRVVYVVEADTSGVAAGMQAAQQQVKQAAQTITSDAQKIENAYDRLGETVEESAKENEKAAQTTEELRNGNEKAAESAKKLGDETDKLGESANKTAQYTQKLNERSEESAKIQKKLNEDIDNVNHSLEKDAKNSELLTQKKKLLNKAVAETSSRLQELKSQQAEVSRAYLNNELPEEEYRDFQREIIATEQALKSYQEQLDDVGKTHVDAAETIGTFKDEFAKNAKTLAVIGGTITAGVTAIGTKAITVADGVDKSAKKIASATGEGAASVEKFEDVVKNVYGDNFGDSFEGIADDVAKITQNLGKMNEQQLTDVTERAYTLRDAFDFGVDESSRAAKAMAQNFGISIEQAYDYMAKGAQDGLNYSGELLDNISEYSVQFAKLGLSADDMFNIFKDGAENGAWNLDKIGDAVKEVAIRMVDGSQSTQEGFAALGMDAETTAAKIAQGGDVARETFKEVMAAIAAMDDPVAQNQAGVNLLGTMWEDLGATAVEALAGITDEAYDCSGALDEIKEMNYDSLGNSLETLGRQIELALEPIGEELIPLITDLVEDIGKDLKAELPQIVEEISGLFKTIVDGVKILWNLRDAVAAGVVAFGSFKAACAIGNIINATVTAVKSFTTATKTAETAQAAFNAVGAANPYVMLASLIAGVVGAVVTFISTAETAAERMERMNEEAEQLIQTSEEYQKKSEGLKDVAARYQEIKSSTENAHEKGVRLKELQDELIEQYGAQAEGIDLVNGEYAEQLGLIDSLINKNKELAVANAQSALATAEEAEKEVSVIKSGSTIFDTTGDNKRVLSFIKGLKTFDGMSVLDTDNYQTSTKLSGTYEERAADLEKLYNYMVNDLGMSETDSQVKGVLELWNSMIENADEKAKLKQRVEAITKEPEPEPYVSSVAAEEERKAKARQSQSSETSGGTSGSGTENSDEFSAAREILDWQRKTGQISDAEYYDQLEALKNQHLTEGSSKWMSIDAEIYQGRNQKTTTTAAAKTATLPTEYTEGKKNLKHRLTMDEISRADYYKQMYGLMGQYGITEGSDEYRALQEEEYTYNKSQQEKESASAEKSKSTSSGDKKGTTISIDSYIPTMWDDAETTKRKLKAAVGLELAGNSTTAHVAGGEIGAGLEALTAAQPSGTSAEAAAAQTAEATLNDVVKLLKELRDSDTKRKISLDVDMYARDLAIGTVAIEDINDIAKMSGKTPFEFTGG